MAGNLKKVSIIGNLGSDPQLRYTSDGTPVASFTVAVNERARRHLAAENSQGEQQDGETTTWFRVSAWRRQAEIVHDLLKKGTSVFVSGDLRTSEFTGNDGRKRFGLEVSMQDMQILTPKSAGVDDWAAEPSRRVPAAGGQADPDADDDIPF
jgi:single-strand DNA-binding protein